MLVPLCIVSMGKVGRKLQHPVIRPVDDRVAVDYR